MRPSRLPLALLLASLASLLACGGETAAGSGSGSRSDVPSACVRRSGTLATFPGGARNAAFVDGTLYFDSGDGGRIARVPVAGGTIETVLDGGTTGAWAAGGGTFVWQTEPVHRTPESATYVDVLHVRDAAGVVHDLPPTTNGAASQLRADRAGNAYWLGSGGEQIT